MSGTGVTQIRLERTGGMGGSPSYELEMNLDGTVTYVGEGLLEMKGTHRGRVDAAAFQALAHEAEQLGFFSMDDRYLTTRTCIAGSITTLLRDGETKRVENEGDGGPAKLTELERRIDGLAATADWDPGSSTASA